MFERFTERAREVVVLAQEEARNLAHNYIGTEHILLGLLRVEDDVAARALGALGLHVDEVRARIARIAPASQEMTAGQIPFTPRAKKVLELSLREALALGSNHIGTEHVLLGLLREGDGNAARVLRDLDAEPNRLREEVLGLLPHSESQERAPEGVAVRFREARFTVGPDDHMHRLLRAAAGRALSYGRDEYGLADLLAAAEARREEPREGAGAGPSEGAGSGQTEGAGSGQTEATRIEPSEGDD